MNTVGSSSLQQSSTIAVGEVTNQWEQSQKNLALLQQAITYLETRLEPIVAERKEAQGAEAGHPEPVRVQFAQSIYDFNVGLNREVDRLQSLLNRIEL